MTSRLRLSALTLAVAFSFAGCGEPPPSADLAIRNVTVIDAVNGTREGRTVLVDDGRISGVVSADEEVDAPESLDGTGRYLIPGLWDFHVHLTYDGRLTDAMPGLFLSHGITSIRDTGGPLEPVLAAVASIRAEGATAPRVFFAGPLLDGEYVVYDGNGRPPLGIANPDPETARANVARLADAGVDFLKIYEMVSPEVFEVLVGEAEARGLPMDGHVPLSMRARDVGPRVQSLEHLRNIEMDCAANPEALLAERRRRLENPQGLSGGDLRSSLHNLQRLPSVEAYDADECAAVIASMASTIQVPTLRLNALGVRPPFSLPDWDELLEELPADVQAEWRAATEASRSSAPMRDTTFGVWSLHLTKLMHDAGVPVAAGTDTPIGFSAPGYALHSEMEMLVRAGFTPMEALESATVIPAGFFGMEGEMGTIEPGKLADLVLLSADPLADISNVRGVEAVVTKGELLTRDELDAMIRPAGSP
jgi:hypothetical protein